MPIHKGLFDKDFFLMSGEKKKGIHVQNYADEWTLLWII